MKTNKKPMRKLDEQNHARLNELVTEFNKLTKHMNGNTEKILGMVTALNFQNTVLARLVRVLYMKIDTEAGAEERLAEIEKEVLQASRDEYLDEIQRQRGEADKADKAMSLAALENAQSGVIREFGGDADSIATPTDAEVRSVQ